MRTLILIAIASLAAGCSTLPQGSDEFTQYQDSFTAEAAARGITIHELRIQFGATSTGNGPHHLKNIAESIPASWVSAAHIVVNESAWRQLNETEREIALYHELMHSALGKAHSATGLMQPNLLSGPQYTANRRRLLDEAFSSTNLLENERGTFDQLVRIK